MSICTFKYQYTFIYAYICELYVLPDLSFISSMLEVCIDMYGHMYFYLLIETKEVFVLRVPPHLNWSLLHVCIRMHIYTYIFTYMYIYIHM